MFQVERGKNLPPCLGVLDVYELRKEERSIGTGRRARRRTESILKGENVLVKKEQR